MTPKEKAIDLMNKFLEYKDHCFICVDELIEEQDMWHNGELNPVKYWQEVKQEIIKLNNQHPNNTNNNP